MATQSNVYLQADQDYSWIAVDRLLAQSEGRSGGHPVKHDIDKKSMSSNRFALLEDSDRRQHTLTSHEDQVTIVHTILNSPLGYSARATLLDMLGRNIPPRGRKRIVLHATNLLKGLGISAQSFEYGEHLGVAPSQAATIVLDVLPGGELHVQTAYAEDVIPQAAHRLADGNDYYFLEAGSDPYGSGSRDGCVRYLVGEKLEIRYFAPDGTALPTSRK